MLFSVLGSLSSTYHGVEIASSDDRGESLDIPVQHRSK